MAKKQSKKISATPSHENETKVTRIKASDKPHKLSVTEKVAKRNIRGLRKPANAPSKTEVAEQKREKQRKRFGGPIAYVKGAWYELRQVRWPDRAMTWKMTGALLAFTAFFVVLILLLDTAFKYLFELMIG